MSVNILVIEDEASMRQILKDVLTQQDYVVTAVGTLATARGELKKKFYNLALVDLTLPDGRGLDMLKEIKDINKETVVIIVTGHASLENSIDALNQGAFAYIQKPLHINELRSAVKNALKMQKLSFDNQELVSKLKDLSLKDAHTELYNYRYLIERLTSEIKRAKRYTFPLSIAMIDIDYFKSINDVYGHQYGDIILSGFAKYLKEFARGNDIVTRYGGEEFVIVLPDTNKEGALIFGKRLLSTIKTKTFGSDKKRLKLKVSIGISSFPDNGNDVNVILNAADKALLNAKETGGNKISSYEKVDKSVINITEKNGKDNVEKLRIKLTKMTNRVNRTLLESVYAFAKTIEAKDFYTSEHAENMVSIVTAIGKKLNLQLNMIENLKHAAVLHDLGKIGIPDSILHKPDKLTKEEFESIKKHPQIGVEIVRPIHFLRGLVPMILCHHERFDGRGYPTGLKGKEIPLGARIIAVADVYEALVSDRPYRKAYSKKDALNIIKEGAGTQFDKEIVDTFLNIMRENKELINKTHTKIGS